MANFLNGLFFSEIFADNAGGQAIDVDGDGNENKADEFIEIGNVSGSDISLDGYEIWSEKNGLLYAFGPGDVLASGETATVVGNYNGAEPAGYYDAGISENGNFLPDGEGNKWDCIYLVNATTGEYIVLSYGRPPRVPDPPTGFPGTTQVGSGESIDSTAPNGKSFIRDANGTLIEGDPSPGVPNIACFAEDTHILTNRGEVLVSDLRPGDRVPTYDEGSQTLLGICARAFSAQEVLQHPHLRPIRVSDALFPGQDSLRVSAAHCLLFKSARAQAFFGTSEVLVRARHLAEAGHAKAEIPRDGVQYYHLLMERHSLVMANGLWAESYNNTTASKEVFDQNLDWKMQHGLAPQDISHEQTVRMVLRSFEAELVLGDARKFSKCKSAPIKVKSSKRVFG